MTQRCQYPPGSIEAADVTQDRIDPHYGKTLKRLLAAHAIAEKLTAIGYERSLGKVTDAVLRYRAEKNLGEERKHAQLIYRALAQIGVSQEAADRSMIPAMSAPSFAAPVRFARRAVDDLELVMASVSLDMTGLIMIGINYRESSYAPHARAAEVILGEEEDHEMFAATELRDAAKRFGCQRVNAALCEWLPRAMNFFGPPGSGFTYDCIRFGLKARDNEELGEIYLSLLERRLDQAGLQMPQLTSRYPYAIA
jgi:1,2-phenylacetyl-CoA epoxidase catalytic subunit